MRFVRVFTIASVLLIGLAFPTSGLADHCGGIATVKPASGPAGTVFTFRTDQVEWTNLSLYRNGSLARTATLEGDRFLLYRIRTDAGDIGRWRIRAAMDNGVCHGEARFTVTAVPDTASAASRRDGSVWPLAGVIGMLAFVLGWRRSRGRVPGR